MRSRLKLCAAISLLTLLLCLMSVMPVAGNPPFQINATEQQETVEAIVDERFTQTTIAQTVNPSTATPSLMPFSTPIPTLTLMPTVVSETNLLTSFGAQVKTSFVYDVAEESFEIYQEGWEAYWNFDFDDAEDAFDELIERESMWAEAYFSRAIARIQQSDYQDALDDIEMSISLNGSLDAGLLFWRMVAHLEEDNVEQAIQDGEQILIANPDDEFSLARLIELYIDEGEYQLAIDTANIALLYAPDNLSLFELRQEAHEELNHDIQAEFDELMVEGIEGWLDYELGDAEDVFDAAIDLAKEEGLDNFNLALAYWHLALTYFLGFEDENALDALEEAEDAFPELGAIHDFRAIIYIFIGDADDRIRALDSGISLVPNYPELYVTRGLYYEEFSQEGLAAIDQWQWLQIVQSHSMTWVNFNPNNGSVTLPFLPGWEHRFLVELDEGQEITVEARATFDNDFNPDAIIVLLNPDGVPIASNDDENPDTRNAEISNYEVETGGTYTIIIGTGTGGSEGLLEIDVDID